MIFVDTSFFVALRNQRDVHHREAGTLLERHADGTLVASNQICGETWTYLRRKVGHEAAVGFLDAVEQSPRIRIEYVSRSQEEAAFRWLKRHDVREYSFVDATSFVLMKELRIRQVLAFDGDYSAAGFVELRAGLPG